jgi:hypothetical protein
MTPLYYTASRPRQLRWLGVQKKRNCLLRATGFTRWLSPTAAFANADFPQNQLQRAEICEGGLQQVEPNEGCEPEPVGAVKMSQQEADEDK